MKKIFTLIACVAMGALFCSCSNPGKSLIASYQTYVDQRVEITTESIALLEEGFKAAAEDATGPKMQAFNEQGKTLQAKAEKLAQTRDSLSTSYKEITAKMTDTQKTELNTQLDKIASDSYAKTPEKFKQILPQDKYITEISIQ